MFNSWKGAWNERTFRYAVRFLIIIGVMAFLSPFIANEKPVFVYGSDGIRFPVFENASIASYNSETSLYWKNNKTDFILYPLVTWSSGSSDYLNANYVGPFDSQKMVNVNGVESKLPLRFYHWLGTDLRGSDVLSGIINGIGISLKIGLISALLALLLGLIIGGAAGLLQNNGLQITIGVFISMLIFTIVLIQMYSLPYTIEDFSNWNKFLIISLLFILLFVIGKKLSKYNLFSKKIKIPIDSIVSRVIEIFNSFPKVVLILVFTAFFKSSISLLIFVLVFTGWTDFARLIRAEFLKISKYDFIEAAKLTGASNLRILLRHILPNALVPITVTFVYAIASFMLIEAGLSFLGVGVPPNIVTWGSLLSEGKENFDAWWLILFPGLILTVTISCFYLVAEDLQKQKN